MNTVKVMTREQMERLRSALTAGGAIEATELPRGAFFLARSEGSVVTAYLSGKVLFQEHGGETLVQLAEGMLARGRQLVPVVERELEIVGVVEMRVRADPVRVIEEGRLPRFP